MQEKQGKNTDCVRIETYDMTEKELAFLCRLVRAFGGFGLSIKVFRHAFHLHKGSWYSVFLIFDSGKYKKAMNGKGRKKIVVLSAESIRCRMSAGETADQIAADFGIGRATLFRYLKKAEKSPL